MNTFLMMWNSKPWTEGFEKPPYQEPYSCHLSLSCNPSQLLHKTLRFFASAVTCSQGFWTTNGPNSYGVPLSDVAELELPMP